MSSSSRTGPGAWSGRSGSRRTRAPATRAVTADNRAGQRGAAPARGSRPVPRSSACRIPVTIVTGSAARLAAAQAPTVLAPGQLAALADRAPGQPGELECRGRAQQHGAAAARAQASRPARRGPGRTAGPGRRARAARRRWLRRPTGARRRATATAPRTAAAAAAPRAGGRRAPAASAHRRADRLSSCARPWRHQHEQRERRPARRGPRHATSACGSIACCASCWTVARPREKVNGNGRDVLPPVATVRRKGVRATVSQRGHAGVTIAQPQRRPAEFPLVALAGAGSRESAAVAAGGRIAVAASSKSSARAGATIDDRGDPERDPGWAEGAGSKVADSAGRAARSSSRRRGSGRAWSRTASATLCVSITIVRRRRSAAASSRPAP